MDISVCIDRNSIDKMTLKGQNLDLESISGRGWFTAAYVKQIHVYVMKWTETGLKSYA